LALPLGQVTQVPGLPLSPLLPSSHAVQLVCPTISVVVPAEQRLQLEEPAEVANRPTWHAVQLELLAAELKPAGQAEQAVEAV
jgi:hypothetical protein